MLMPRKVRHRKLQRGRMTGMAKGGTRLAFGDYGIQALEPGWITNRQIEAARIAMTRHIKRGGKVWINVFPDKPITQKPAETRMGSGKGNPEKWVAVVKPGRVLFELSGVPETDRPRSDAARDPQAADEGALHRARGGGVAMTKAAELRELTDETLADRLARGEAGAVQAPARARDRSARQHDRDREVQARDRADPHAHARARDRGARSRGQEA